VPPLARKFSPTALEPLLQLLPLEKAPSVEEVKRMSEHWWGPRLRSCPRAVYRGLAEHAGPTCGRGGCAG